MKLEEYLVQAASANFHRVDIIHGKGNGILRRVVSEVVAGNSLVKSFKPGEWGQGDYGVTVVELKE
jgi:DNA mismatch repair protein MutS2